MATSLSSQISAFATQAGTDVGAILAKIGNLSSLTTTQKASLVVALNELKAAIDQHKTDTTTEISTAISAAVSGLINGAPETLDTLKELADAIAENKELIDGLTGFVRYDAAQTLTADQQAQALSNIGGASASALSAVETTANNAAELAQTANGTANAASAAAQNAQNDVNALETAVGDTATDFVQIYTTARGA